MSRIGKQPITIVKGVNIDLQEKLVSVSGPKGTLQRTFHPDMLISIDAGVATVSRPSDSNEHRALHGLTRSLLHNMVVGVSEGFKRVLVIEGVGYRAEMSGNNLVLYVGYSHPVVFQPERDMVFAVEDKGRTIVLTSSDKEFLGEITARVRKTRPPEPYKGKGIRYDNEVVRRKAGKTGKV